jgi:hypothetical protein
MVTYKTQQTSEAEKAPVSPLSNGENDHDDLDDKVVEIQTKEVKPSETAAEQVQKKKSDADILDKYEELARDTILDDDDGNDPGQKDEISQMVLAKKLPPFVIFRTNPETWDFWGVPVRADMEDSVVLTSKSFAPCLDDDVDLVRTRLYETVTTDGVIRYVWCQVTEPGPRANSWISSKQAALEHGMKVWTTMRSRKKLQQWTYRPSRKQDYGEPKFSRRTRAQLLEGLDKLGILINSTDHPYFKKATDSE